MLECTQKKTYNPWSTQGGRLAMLSTLDGARRLQDLRYTYAAMGNVLTLEDGRSSSYNGTTRPAERQGSGSPAWLPRDHLCSTSLTTDANGNKIAGLRYNAWGAVRHADGTTPTKYTYTGQYSDSYSKLMWYSSRWYDPELARWTQPDPIVPESQGVQAWDRYAYVNNSPLNWVDPSGHTAQCLDCGGGGNLSDEQKLDRIRELREDDRNRNPEVLFDESLGGNVKYLSEVSDPSNPSIGGIVVAGVALTVGVVLTEILFTWAEVAIAPAAFATPIIGIPMEAVLISCSIAVLDFEFAYWSYAARVYQNPNEKQELELLPPWGFGEN